MMDQSQLVRELTRLATVCEQNAAQLSYISRTLEKQHESTDQRLKIIEKDFHAARFLWRVAAGSLAAMGTCLAWLWEKVAV